MASEENAVATVKEKRRRLESRIACGRTSQLELLSSVRSLIEPRLVSSLDLSVRLVSSFENRPFEPTPPLPEPKPKPKPTNPPPSSEPVTALKSEEKREEAEKTVDADVDADVGGLGSPLAVVRSMVAVALLERVPFTPVDSSAVLRKLESDQKASPAERAALREVGGESGAILAVEMALRSMADENGCVELEEFVVSGKSRVMVLGIDRTRLVKELPENAGSAQGQMMGWMFPARRPPMGFQHHHGRLPPMKPRTEDEDLKDVEALLSKKSFLEQQKSKTGEELLDLIHRPTAKETATAAKFKTKGGSQLKEYCSSLTKEDCRRQLSSFMACDKVHFRRIIALHTDVNLGDCSFLDTCRHMKTCKYVHYELDPTPDVAPMVPGTIPKPLAKPQRAEYCSEVELGEPQWINCDIRNFRMDILGQFGVIMADPPWDIHMELPYGTMADDEMRNLNVPALQTDGLIFLWVTGRAMELGRECLDLWGYKRVEEIIWVKTNQLQRIIRTGRTGHWLNHSKEHCLVGIKGDPLVNRNIDTDVIVAEVRETSRKPDEMYPLLERISPRTRKLELFARMHNTHAGWMAMGNQLSGVRLVDEGLRARFKAAYPDVEVQPFSDDADILT